MKDNITSGHANEKHKTHRMVERNPTGQEQNKTKTHRIKEHIAGGHTIIMYMTLWMNKTNHNRQDNIQHRTRRTK